MKQVIPLCSGAFSYAKLLINMKKLAILTSLLASSTLWGQGLDQVTLEELSSSQRSMTLDRGSLEGYAEGNYAQFFLQRGNISAPKLFLVAEGELVKSLPGKSYWMIRKVHIPKALREGHKLLVLNSKNVLSGRPLKVKSRYVVMPEKDFKGVSHYLDTQDNGVPDRLVKESGNYEVSKDIYEKKKHREADVVVSEYEVLKKKGGTYYSEEYGDVTEEKYFVGNRQIPVGDIKNIEDKKLFDSISEGYATKTNNMKYGLNSFYKDQEKLPEVRDLSKQGSITSVYNDYEEDVKLAGKVSPRAAAKIKRDGIQWSEDLDDKALRRYFIETGLAREEKRKDLALNELDGHEVMFHFSNAFNSHATAKDPNYQARAYNIGVSYDLHLSKVSPEMKSWSLQFLYETGVVNYDLGGLNAKAQESVYGAYVNYYFYNNPLTLNSFIFLLGAGLKNGSSKATSVDLSKEYSYQVMALPALQLMGKYRFRSGDAKEDSINIGTSVNLGINLDSKKLSVVDSVADEDAINSKISVSELRYTLGMSVYF